ncbi:hypothetical protein [Microbacterium sp. cx-59]|uniref:hypothetical protein n=1 Tax=Microbacterium sp. cx-59 TaxID=2891207 RepID=UPI001E341ED6|nr:hypothetical protein [Microbacterium sp. cx-59]MCC4909456.1 hypothetical protein [Microbacterium sp. cx-59]
MADMFARIAIDYAGVYIVAAVGLALAAVIAAVLIRVDPADAPAERVAVSAH